MRQGEIKETQQLPNLAGKKKLKGAAAISSWRSTTHGIRAIQTVSIAQFNNNAKRF